MKYRQGDIIEINFHFPDVGFKPHFAIIVSNDELQELEGYLYVLISSKRQNPEYAYTLTPEMVSFSFDKQSHVKCHILELSTNRDIIRKVGTIKRTYLLGIQEKIKEAIF
jgi:hypothetical protein